MHRLDKSELSQVLTGAEEEQFLCHLFLAHAAQRHRGNSPRFMAQPPLYPKERFNLARSDENYSLVEQAIRLGLLEQ